MSSSSWVSWVIVCDSEPSHFDSIASLAAEMSAYFLEHEPDTTHFEWSSTAERSHVHIHERYANSEQALAHMAAFGQQFGSRFMALLKPVSVVVYGNPSAELRSALEGLSPAFTQPFAGFHR